MKNNSHICGRTSFALAVLLAIQLTGFSCLSEWEVGNAWATSAENGYSTQPSPSELEADDGCPCHFYFSPVDVTVPEPVFPLNETSTRPPGQYTLSFNKLPFHPPLQS